MRNSRSGCGMRMGKRPSRLHIEVTEAGRVHVGGLVREVGRGQLSL